MTCSGSFRKTFVLKRKTLSRFSKEVNLLSSLGRFGIKLGLERIDKLLDALGHPEKKLKVIHLAGTNGKGSVGAMLAYILEAAGFRVGLFTSPHLMDWRERLAVFEGKGFSLISKREFVQQIKQLKPVINRLKKEKNEPTIFEVLTALALNYFFHKEVDFAVMEAGLGGRLDATNIVKPLVSVITNVELEHKEYLGATKKQIAREKSGIIKKNGIVVSGESRPAVWKVIKEKSDRKAARFIRVGKEVKLLSYRLQRFKNRFVTRFSVEGLNGLYSNLLLPLLGRHQAVNAAVAIAAIESLAFSGIRIPKRAVRPGLQSVYWPARLEMVSDRPVVLLDGGHNPAAAKAVAATLKELGCFRERIFIFGCLKDKDVSGMLKAYLPLFTRIIATQPENSRALPAEILADKVSQYGRKCLIKNKAGEALKDALRIAQINDLVLITGSLYLAGEVRSAIV